MEKSQSQKPNDFVGNYDWCSDLDLPPVKPRSRISNIHQLAHVLIYLAGGNLPWLAEMPPEDKKGAAARVRQRWKGRLTPQQLVDLNRQYLDPVLYQWIFQALSLKYDQYLDYQVFLDYLWN